MIVPETVLPFKETARPMLLDEPVVFATETANVAEVLPAATVTVFGADTRVVAPDVVIVAVVPLAGAGAFSFTVV